MPNPLGNGPHILKPIINEKVEEEIDKILVAKLIFPIEESEWVIPIVIQHKKRAGRGIQVCVDFRDLNAVCIHKPFPTPFNNKVLDQTARKEAYSYYLMDSRDTIMYV